jgi:hypothetical protein
MPLDPARGFPMSPDQKQADKLAELERRVAALERAPNIQVVSGTPTPTQTPREGTPVLDKAGNRVGYWLNGAWKWVGLT